MADTRWMQRRREGWYVIVEAPAALRERLGKRRFVRSLQTRDAAVARARRWKELASIKGEIEAARSDPAGASVTTEAMAWREAMEAARKGDSRAATGTEGDPEGFIRDLVTERAAELAATDGGKAATFFGLATGTATLLQHNLEPWLAEGGRRGQFTERTKDDHRRALKDLADWMTAEGLPATVEAVSRRVAGRYLSSHLLQSGRAAKTVSKAVSSLASYWTWLTQRGFVDGDHRSPWSGQAPAHTRPAEGSEGRERAFTQAEAAALLAHCADDLLMTDFLRVAFLTGMRREEIARLTVSDVQAGVFVVQRGKTAAARRRVPVHPDLTAIVAARCAGKAATDHLFHDLPGAASKRGERADALGKRFTRLRRSAGVQDGEGRRSLVNLHSARRFFVTEAVNAGQPPHVVSRVVGHTEGRRGMTLGRYWSGGDDAALRAVVEAVRLPTSTP